MAHTFGSQRQADLCEFEASPVYRVSSSIPRAIQRNPVLKIPPPSKRVKMKLPREHVVQW